MCRIQGRGFLKMNWGRSSTNTVRWRDRIGSIKARGWGYRSRSSLQSYWAGRLVWRARWARDRRLRYGCRWCIRRREDGRVSTTSPGIPHPPGLFLCPPRSQADTQHPARLASHQLGGSSLPIPLTDSVVKDQIFRGLLLRDSPSSLGIFNLLPPPLQFLSLR